MDINDYLTHEEMKEIAIEEFRNRIRLMQNSDLERIINNSAYQVVWSAVDKSLDDKATEMLKDKVVSIIKEMTFFNVFSKPNSWDREKQQAYSVIVETTRENKDLVDQAIKDGFISLTKKQKAEIAYQATIEGLSKR